ncbi:MAG: response regulator [Burkholderiales bacterium]|nr:response regulator [Burkholderiales bacterium]
MNRGASAASRTQSQRTLLFVVVGVLVLVLAGVAYVQWRQYRLLDGAAHFQNEGLGWSFGQLETEELRLRHQLHLYVEDPQRASADLLRLRYDIFVSRIGLVDHERAADIMRGTPGYRSTMAQVHAFVQAADRYLGATPALPLDAAAGRELLGRLAALNDPLHDLSLAASHLLYERATERDRAVRLQSQLGIALTAFQCVLLLALAFIVLRQLRALTERRRNLEALADNLSAARHDAEAANRAKSVFLANMSHEIRTPFHGMLGMMSLLQDGGLTPKQASYLDTARESAHHLLTILNDILDISQLESGKLQVVPQTVDLLQLIAQVDALMRAQAHAKGLALRVDVAPDVPRWVRADPTRLKQILFNLLSNAIKFTGTGTIALGVTVSGGGRLDFSVTDTGAGMDEATLAHLFQRFVQGDASPSRRATGTGLGLEISRDLARLMGGDITVRSQPGVGSTFTATLPLPSAGAPALAANDAIPPADGRAAPLRVLVAEDHPVNRAYMEAVLDKLGHHAVFTADGAAAVRAVEEQPLSEPFDIVLMDLHMPGVDGFTAARAIRALAPPRGRVPIVALTADAFQESRHLALEAGMDGFLTKPAHLPQLRETLQRYGGGAAAGRPAPAAAVLAGEHAGTPADTYADTHVDTSDAVLDRTTLDELREALSSDKCAELLGAFFAGRAQTLDELRRAAATGALADLRNRAHGLKGASSSLGMRGVADVADRLQSGQTAATPTDIARLIDQLDRQFSASFEACRRLGLLPGSVPAQPRPAAQTTKGSGSSRMPKRP